MNSARNITAYCMAMLEKNLFSPAFARRLAGEVAFVHQLRRQEGLEAGFRHPALEPSNQVALADEAARHLKRAKSYALGRDGISGSRDVASRWRRLLTSPICRDISG